MHYSLEALLIVLVILSARDRLGPAIVLGGWYGNSRNISTPRTRIRADQRFPKTMRNDTAVDGDRDIQRDGEW